MFITSPFINSHFIKSRIRHNKQCIYHLLFKVVITTSVSNEKAIHCVMYHDEKVVKVQITKVFRVSLSPVLHAKVRQPDELRRENNLVQSLEVRTVPRQILVIPELKHTINTLS